jgi:hypothetical protein
MLSAGWVFKNCFPSEQGYQPQEKGTMEMCTADGKSYEPVGLGE